MSFLNPFFFIGAVTLAIPILIHLVRREKSEIVPFSSLMFLLKVPKRSIRQQQWKNLLLMALRLLILVLLVNAFARPYFTQPNQPAAATGGARGVAMLLDNSYSMRYGANFERLKNEANQRIDAMGGGDRMAIIAFNDAAMVVQQPTSDKNQLKAAVSALEPSYRGTRYFEAFAAADRLLAQMGVQEKQLVMISDFQRVGWNRSSRESIIGSDVKAEMVRVGAEQPVNVGIESISVEPTTFTRTYAGRIIARVRNYRKDQPVSVAVSLQVNDRPAGERRTINVPLNSTALAEFSGFELPLGFSKGKVRVESDDPLAIDNEFLFALERREKLNLLIIDDGKPQQSVFLQTAFTASNELPFEVKVVSGNVGVDELAKHKVVIVNDARRLTDAVRDRMAELRRSGQGQLIALAQNADINWWNGFTGLPVKLTQKIYVQKDRGKPSVSLTSFDRNHRIFELFRKTSRLSIGGAQFFAYTEMTAKPDSPVLAKFDNGAPALVESPAADRGLLVFASGLDDFKKGWNDLAYKGSFVVLMHEAVRYLSGYSEARGWYALGDPVPVPGGLETATAAVVQPDNTRQSLGEIGPGKQTFFSPTMPGFHEVQVGREVRRIAVNPPLNEGNLEAMPPEDLLASVKRTEGEAQQAGLFASDSVEDHAKRQMGWWYLLIIALAAGIAEIYIANRGQRGQAEVKPIKGMI